MCVVDVFLIINSYFSVVSFAYFGDRVSAAKLKNFTITIIFIPLLHLEY